MESPPYSFAKAFGGAVALILLVLYASIMGWLVYEVLVAGWNGRTSADQLGQGAVTVVTAVGGLISALVISKLALTKPGATPSMNAGLSEETGQIRAPEPQVEVTDGTPLLVPSGIAKAIAVLYLTVWIVVGLVALLAGTVIYPGLNQTVEDTGTSWLGLAIAAGYAYFGLDPRKV